MKLFIFSLMIISMNLSAKGLTGEAFGHPGVQPNWTKASKTIVGTSVNSQKKSPVWFTASEGVLTEVYFPSIDIAQIRDSQILVTDGKSFYAEEKDLNHKTQVINAVEAQTINTDPNNQFEMTHHFYTDNESATLIEEITLAVNVDGLKFYLLTNPQLNNTGYYDSATVGADGFKFTEGETSLEVTTNIGFLKKSVGFVGHSDGYQDLKDNFQMNYQFTNASNGNVASMGELNIPSKKGKYKFFVIYSFKNRNYSKERISFDDLIKIRENYYKNWEYYFSKILSPKFKDDKEKLLYLRSIFTLKAHEDKLNPGAIVASLSIPWGEEQKEEAGKEIGGYHLVWPRDLYNIATALLIAGDRETSLDSLRFLKSIQYQDKDGFWYFGNRVYKKKGAFPQNVWIDGRNYWSGFQIDQTAYPVLLFYNLYQKATSSEKAKLLNEFKPMLTDALEFMAFYGPWTQQERWEENFGISPSSFASVAAAMKAGAKIFPNSFGERLDRLATDWITKPNDNIETWTVTRKGFYGDGEYYLRIAGGDSFDAIWNPDWAVNTHIANSGARVDQRKILDQGFLQLSLLGVKSAGNEIMKKSKDLVDRHISFVTPNGRGYYRYSFDAYGENSKGRLWPLLSGEHARFYIERYQENDLSWNEASKNVQSILDTMYNFANDGLMIPEQVFENSGEGTGAATPLAWSHAEYIRVLWSFSEKRNVENVLR